MCSLQPLRVCFFLLSMKQIDANFTKAIQEWLNTPAADRDITKGATMLLQLNRNRALYNSILSRPAKYSAKLEYELRKHLNIRVHNMAVSDVVAMERKVMPRVESTLQHSPHSTVAITSDTDFPDGQVAKGKRADHDSLPEEIKQLWDSNAERYFKINHLFNELKGMADAEPCDRFAKLVILERAESAYRKALELYDGYTPVTSTETIAQSVDRKRVSALRKSISTHKTAYAKTDDKTKKAILVDKLQSCVDELISLGAGLAESSKAELSAIGITF